MIEINRNQWTVLRDLYQNDRINLTGYDLLNCYINCVENAENVKLFVTDDNWQEHGSFVLIHNFENKADIYFNTLNATLDKLQSALSTLNLNIPHSFCGYSNGFRKLVEKCWLERCLQLEELEHQLGTFVYHLPRSEIQPFELNSDADIVIGHLQIEHAELVDEHWTFRSKYSLPLIKNLIRNNISAGAFDKDGKLLAWCLRSSHGSLSHLNVLPSHRRLGLGSLLVRFMAQAIAATGAEVLTTIVFSNESSRNMFKKLGFRHVDDVYWATVPCA